MKSLKHCDAITSLTLTLAFSMMALSVAVVYFTCGLKVTEPTGGVSIGGDTSPVESGIDAGGTLVTRVEQLVTVIKIRIAIKCFM
jgi:hypothetical protein